jgi:hypothetical protein
MTIQDITVTTEAGPVTVRGYHHHKAKLRLPSHPYGKGRLVIEPGEAAAHCDEAAVVLLIQRQTVEPELSFAQIRGLDRLDRVALVEAILGGAA